MKVMTKEWKSVAMIITERREEGEEKVGQVIM